MSLSGTAINNTELQNGGINVTKFQTPLSGANITLGSGVNILNTVSGINSLGTAANPFSGIFSTSFNGIALGNLLNQFVAVSGGTMTGNLTFASGAGIRSNNDLTMSANGSFSLLASFAGGISGVSNGPVSFSGSTLNLQSIAGINTKGSITPATSGTDSLGTTSLPFGTLTTAKVQGPSLNNIQFTPSGTVVEGLSANGVLINSIVGGGQGSASVNQSGVDLAFQNSKFGLSGNTTRWNTNNTANFIEMTLSGTKLSTNNAEGYISLINNSTSGNVNILNNPTAGTPTSIQLHYSGNVMVSGNVIPHTSGTYNLGDSGHPWDTLYVKNLVSASTSGSFVHISGDTMTGNLTISNAALQVTSSSNNLNSSNIFAVGDSNSISGTASAAIGVANDVSGSYNLVVGVVNAIRAIDSTSNIVAGSSNILAGASQTNIIGGSNNAASGLGNIVGGNNNAVSGNYNSAFGQQNTLANAATNSLVAGNLNKVLTNYSVVGGQSNITSGSAYYSAVFGNGNVSSGNPYTLVAGGNNIVTAVYSLTVGNNNKNYGNFGVVGGQNNQINSNGNSATVFGNGNTVDAFATLTAGDTNNVGTNGNTSITAGGQNRTDAYGALVVGNSNIASGSMTVVYGVNNKSFPDAFQAIVGGIESMVSGSAAISIGYGNRALGNYAVALGKNAYALNSGTFVFTDSQNPIHSGTLSNAMYLRFENGIRLSPDTTLYADNIINTGSGAFVHVSGDTMVGTLNFTSGASITSTDSFNIVSSAPGRIITVAGSSGTAIGGNSGDINLNGGAGFININAGASGTLITGGGGAITLSGGSGKIALNAGGGSIDLTANGGDINLNGATNGKHIGISGAGVDIVSTTSADINIFGGTGSGIVTISGASGPFAVRVIGNGLMKVSGATTRLEGSTSITQHSPIVSIQASGGASNLGGNLALAGQSTSPSVFGVMISGTNPVGTGNGIEIRSNARVYMSGQELHFSSLSSSGTFFDATLVPEVSGTQNIGLPNQYWNTAYINSINTNTVNGIPASGVLFNHSFNEVPAGAINNVNTTYTLAHTPVNVSLQLYKNGIYLIPSGVGAPSFDYVLSGNTILTQTAPLSGATLITNYVYIV